MKTTVTNDQIATYTRREKDLYRRMMEGALAAEAVLAGLQKLIEGQFPIPTTLSEMIAVCFAKNRVNIDVIERNFPLEKEGAYDASGLSLFGGDREYSINEVKTTIEPKGGRLEGLVRGLAFLKENPGALKDGPIVFPASYWAPSSVGVPYAYLDDDEPKLVLIWGLLEDRWIRSDRFLVSRESST